MSTKFDPNNVPETVWCGPMKVGRCYATDVMRMDAFEEIKAYTGKVCIVHGTADKIVDIVYSKRAAEVYRNSAPETLNGEMRVGLHSIEGGAHMFSKKHDAVAMEKLREFADLA